MNISAVPRQTFVDGNSRRRQRLGSVMYGGCLSSRHRIGLINLSKLDVAGRDKVKLVTVVLV
jgi:hypothetical protein